MHPYSVDSPERRNLPFYVAGAAIAATFGAREVLQYLGIDAGVRAYVPSSFVIYGFLYIMFDRFIWKLNVLRRLGLVRIPDMAGLWEGELRSSHSGLQKPHGVQLRVHQTWSTLLLTLESDRSISRSNMASLATITPNELELLWEYRAESKEPIDFNFNHRGVTRL